MVIDTLQPAAQAADGLSRLVIELRREIDSARRGLIAPPRATLEAIIEECVELRRLIPRG